MRLLGGEQVGDTAKEAVETFEEFGPDGAGVGDRLGIKHPIFDHILVRVELVAREIDVTVVEAIPPVIFSLHAVDEDPSKHQVAAEIVAKNERRDIALPAGGVNGRPFVGIRGCGWAPRGSDRNLELLECGSGALGRANGLFGCAERRIMLLLGVIEHQ